MAAGNVYCARDPAHPPRDAAAAAPSAPNAGDRGGKSLLQTSYSKQFKQRVLARHGAVAAAWHRWPGTAGKPKRVAERGWARRSASAPRNCSLGFFLSPDETRHVQRVSVLAAALDPAG